MNIKYNGKPYKDFDEAIKDGINDIVINEAKEMLKPHMDLINKHNGTIEIVVDKEHNAKINISGLPKHIEDKING